MARKVALPLDMLALDKEVTGLVSRVGALENPGMFINRYIVERELGSPTWVTVKFIADDEFCVAEEETK